MSGLCGYAGLVAEPARHADILTAMALALRLSPGERPHTETADMGGLVASALPEGVHSARVAGVSVLIWGEARAADGTPAAEFAAREYPRLGSALLERLSGHFALALLADDGREALIATDRMGVQPMTYQTAAAGLVFASDARVLGRHPAVRLALRPQALFDYVYFHMVPGPGTAYLDAHRLPAGGYARVRDGRLETGRYWRPQFHEQRVRPFGFLKDAFFESLREGVGRQSAGADTAAFLSGGTDSSTVCGLLRRQRGAEEPVRAYSIGFEAEGYDEMYYARIAARHFGLDHRSYYVTPDDVVRAVPQVAAAYDAPFGNASAVPAYFCARRAREDGVGLMLAGDGGDELFGGNERYAKQYVFSLYGRVPAALRRGLIEPLARGPLRGLPPVRKLHSYVEQASTPLPARLETYNLLNRFGAGEVFTAEFLAAVDPGEPSRLLEETYRGADADSQINRLLVLDWRFTLADSDLPKVNRMCDLAGVRVAYPLLDDAVLNFSLDLPPHLKLRGRKLRYFFKKALEGFLPDEILRKQKHGFGLPFGVWMASHAGLRELAYDSLSALRKRSIVRPDFLARLVDTHRGSHAAYYGTMIWVLMMLEQWLALADTPANAKPPGG